MMPKLNHVLALGMAYTALGCASPDGLDPDDLDARVVDAGDLDADGADASNLDSGDPDASESDAGSSDAGSSDPSSSDPSGPDPWDWDSGSRGSALDAGLDEKDPLLADSTDAGGPQTPHPDDCYTIFADFDLDRLGDPAEHRVHCQTEIPEGWSGNADDCDPKHRLSTEVCSDGVDNDCDRQIDEADPETLGTLMACRDKDGDGFPGRECELHCPEDGVAAVPAGWYVEADIDRFDCNDSERNVHPDADEICGDGVDNNCRDDLTDEPTRRYFPDLDGDGYGGGAFADLCGPNEMYPYDADNDCAPNDAAWHSGEQALTLRSIGENSNDVNNIAVGTQTRAHGDRKLGSPTQATLSVNLSGDEQGLNVGLAYDAHEDDDDHSLLRGRVTYENHWTPPQGCRIRGFNPHSDSVTKMHHGQNRYTVNYDCGGSRLISYWFGYADTTASDHDIFRRSQGGSRTQHVRFCPITVILGE